jgi:hypothetical protein
VPTATYTTLSPREIFHSLTSIQTFFSGTKIFEERHGHAKYWASIFGTAIGISTLIWLIGLIYGWWTVRDLTEGLRPLAESFAWIKDEFVGWKENREEEREAKETEARLTGVKEIEGEEKAVEETEMREEEGKENEARDGVEGNEATEKEAQETEAKEPEYTSQASTTKPAAPTTELTKSLDAPENPPFSLL